jgi:hypothetical protein
MARILHGRITFPPSGSAGIGATTPFPLLKGNDHRAEEQCRRAASVDGFASTEKGPKHDA